MINTALSVNTSGANFDILKNESQDHVKVPLKEVSGFDYVREKLANVWEKSLHMPQTIVSQISIFTSSLFSKKNKAAKTVDKTVDLFEARYTKIEDTDAFKKTMEKVKKVAAGLPEDYLTNKNCYASKKRIEKVSGGYLFKKGNKVVFIDTEHVLGRGSFKTVFLAYDIFNNQVCAFADVNRSKMSKKDTAMLLQEIEMMKKFRGTAGEGVIGSIENVVRDEKGIKGFLMPFYNRGELSNYLDNHLDDAREKDLWRIADDIIHGIEVLAKQRDPVIHRDLKDANVMLHRGADGKLHAKIIDFGLATTVSRETDPNKKKKLSICGTLSHLCPEVVKAFFKKSKGKISDEKFVKRVNSTKRDVWSLGMILYQMLKKEKPELATYSDESFFLTMKKIDDDDFDKDFSKEASDRFLKLMKPKTIEDAVRYALSCEPKLRYSAKELRQQMKRLKSSGARWKAPQKVASKTLENFN